MMMLVRSTSVAAPSQAKMPAHAVNPRMSVQAGPKSQSGGCQVGLTRFLYQGPMVVNTPPAPPRMTAQRINRIVDVSGTTSLWSRLTNDTIGPRYNYPAYPNEPSGLNTNYNVIRCLRNLCEQRGFCCETWKASSLEIYRINPRARLARRLRSHRQFCKFRKTDGFRKRLRHCRAR